MTALTLVTKNTFRNRRRSLSSFASLTVFFAVLTVLWAVWFSFYTPQGAGPEGSRLVTRNRVSLFFPVLTYYRNQIRKIPGVVNIVPLDYFGGIYKDGGPGTGFTQYGTDANEIFQVYTEWSAPAADIEAFKNDPAGAAAPRALADKFHWKIGDRIILKGTITPINPELNLRTIFDTTSSWDALVFHWQPIVASMPYLDGMESFFIVRLDTPGSVTRVSKQIDQTFRNAPQPTRTDTESAFALASLDMIGNIRRFLTIVSFATIFTLLLITANTIALNMRERIREIAVMRVLGYSQASLFSLLLAESSLICFNGCVAGIVCGKVLIEYVSHIPAGDILSSVTIGIEGVFVLLAIALIIGLLSAAIPAYQASHGSIVKNIRFVG